MAKPFYVTRYLCHGYRLSDAFRPTPNYGQREFRCDVDKMPPHTDAEFIEAAKIGAPGGYWLQKVERWEDGQSRQLYGFKVPGHYYKGNPPGYHPAATPYTADEGSE